MASSPLDLALVALGCHSKDSDRFRVISPICERAEFTVDGVDLVMEVVGRRSVRLTSEIVRKLPSDEAIIRGWLGKYLRYCDSTDALLCSDQSGALLLSTDIDVSALGGEQMRSQMSEFCDSAVYWAAVCRRYRGNRAASGVSGFVIRP